MKTNLKEFREKSLLTAKQLSILLNVSVHTYIAMEQDKFSLSPEIIIMIAKIYQMPTHFLFEDSILNQEEIDAIMINFSKLPNEEKRFQLAVKNLTGGVVEKSLHRQIRKLKNQIHDEIN